MSEKTLPRFDPEAVDSLLRGATALKEGIAGAGAKIARTFESFSKMLGEALLYPCQNEMDPYNGFWPEPEPSDIPENVYSAGELITLNKLLLDEMPLPTIRKSGEHEFWALMIPRFIGTDDNPSFRAWRKGLLPGHEYQLQVVEKVSSIDYSFTEGKFLIKAVWHPHSCAILGRQCPGMTDSV